MQTIEVKSTDDKVIISIDKKICGYRFFDYYAGEDVYSAIGQTQEGRYLIVLFVYKKTSMC